MRLPIHWRTTRNARGAAVPFGARIAVLIAFIITRELQQAS
jgi:hypothetical protein